ncbi:hypothetical protein [Bradyrhizobium sp. Arg816]|uniref:hypothetical protein n=1 Tax=Bradyrhizobium sp. Arg816 TaxID=2998491 RepID=UPI00249F4D5F|nr:hypothetical protein [Bradyrhizobium sp. Arg816]MDI3565404.1 hypothetical protein [Bradyrhizobium sp. Arg816]
MDASMRESGDIADDEDVVTSLKQTIAELRARVAELEQPPPQWTPLKRAASVCGLNYETVRLWAERGLIDACREGGRWMVNLTSLKARQARIFGGAQG